MYRIPKDIDLSKIIGEITTQIRVGQFDIQFEIGEVGFSIWSPINLFRGGVTVGRWEENMWPSPSFVEVLNVKVANFSIPDERTIIISFDNDLEVHLVDSSDQYESMQISIKGDKLGPWII